MFVANKEITVSWVIHATSANYVNTDFVVTVKKPDGGSIRSPGAILESDFLAPDAENSGLAEYKITPDQKGVWTIILSTGVSGNSEIYSSYRMRVSEPDTHVRQQVKLG